MTATSAPFGLEPVRHLNGGTIRNFAFRGGIASAYGTSIGTGDPVRLVTAGVFERAAAGETIDGVFAGCEYTDASGRRNISAFWPASTVATEIIAYVYLDKGIVYRVQADGAVAASAVGDAADLILGTVNTRSGQSTTQLDATVVTAGNSAQCKIVGLWQNPENAWGDAYTIVEVIINEQGLGFIPGNAI